MNSQNWIQFAIVALFVGMSVFGWVIRQLNEIKAKREVQQQRLRVQQEALRTGRTAEPDAEETAAAAAAQAEAERRAALAEKRRQRLEELRRRQQAQRRTAGSTATASTGKVTPPVVSIAFTPVRPMVFTIPCPRMYRAPGMCIGASMSRLSMTAITSTPASCRSDAVCQPSSLLVKTQTDCAGVAAQR